MTATNHALTGAIIGLLVAHPVALPLAFMSHYILDAIPHFGSPFSDEVTYKSRWFRRYLVSEALICFGIVLILFSAQPAHWLLAAVCAFLAAAPDLLSINLFNTIRNDEVYNPNLYVRFASKIQWFEKPIGGIVEIVWFGCAVVILAKIITS